MTEKLVFIKNMEAELPITVKVMRAIPKGLPDFKPHVRSQTAKQIVQTMIAEVLGMKSMLNGEENVFTPIETFSDRKSVV